MPFVVPDVLEHARRRRRRPGATRPRSCRGSLYQRTGDLGLLARQLPSMRAWVDRIAGLAGADRLWTGGFQFGDWLDPTAPPDAPSRPRPTRTSSPPPTSRARPRSSACAAAGPRRRRHGRAVRRPRRRGPGRLRPRVRHRRRPGAQRRRDRLRPGARVGAAARPTDQRAPRRRAPGRPGPDVRLPDQHRLRRHAADHRRPDRARHAGRGLPAAAADRLPVLAVRGDDGRDHGLGALGQPCCPTAASTRAR